MKGQGRTFIIEDPSPQVLVQQKYCCKWGGTLKQSAANSYQQQFRLMNKARQKFLSSTLNKSKLQHRAGRYSAT